MQCCGNSRRLNCSDLQPLSLTCIFQAPSIDGAKTAPNIGDTVVWNGTNWQFQAGGTLGFDDNQVMTMVNTDSIIGTMVPSAPTGSDNQVNYTLTATARLSPTSPLAITSTATGLSVAPPNAAQITVKQNLTTTTTGMTIVGTGATLVPATVNYNLTAGIAGLNAGVQGTLGGTGATNTYVGADGQLHLLPSTTGAVLFSTTAVQPTIVKIVGGGSTVQTQAMTIDVAGMVGATAIADGVSGLAPKPLAGEDDEVLFGDGTYKPALTIIRDTYSVLNGDIVIGLGSVTLTQTVDTTYPITVYRMGNLAHSTVDYTQVGQVLTFPMKFIVQDEIDIIYKKAY